MEPLKFYDQLKTPPNHALKAITAGRLKGKSDINPQWRIEIMTTIFGMCGFGWKYEITKQWTEPADNGQLFAFVNVNLYVKVEDNWSDAIPGTGGTLLIVNEKNGTYSDDEAYKKSLTDAMGVAMKAIGVGADVYMGLLNNGGSKYPTDSMPENTGTQAPIANASKTNFIQRSLTHKEVSELWNGKIYKGNIVYIGKEKIQPPTEQIEKLKAHEKYQKDGGN